MHGSPLGCHHDQVTVEGTKRRRCCPGTTQPRSKWSSPLGELHPSIVTTARLLMGVHHFFWFVWEGVVVELPVR